MSPLTPLCQRQRPNVVHDSPSQPSLVYVRACVCVGAERGQDAPKLERNECRMKVERKKSQVGCMLLGTALSRGRLTSCLFDACWINLNKGHPRISDALWAGPMDMASRWASAKMFADAVGAVRRKREWEDERSEQATVQQTAKVTRSCQTDTPKERERSWASKRGQGLEGRATPWRLAATVTASSSKDLVKNVDSER